MVAGGAAAAPVPFPDFLLRKMMVKGQIKHFLFLNRQAGEGLYQQAVVQDNRIAAKVQYVFLVRLRGLEMFIIRT